jgi:large subunit ribosomal protein L30
MAPAKAIAVKAAPTGTSPAAKAPAAKAPAAEAPAAEAPAAKAPAAKAPSHAAEATIEIKQVRSGIGTKPKHRGTLRALGLGRIGRTHVLPDRPEIRGMVARVAHLVEVRTDGEGTDK